MKRLKIRPNCSSRLLAVLTSVLTGLIALCIVSCKSTRPLLAESEKIVTESIREEVRDTVILIEKDRALIRALLECDSVGKIRIRQILEYEAGKRTKPPGLTINDNVLEATAEVDSLSIYLLLKDRYRERNRETADIRYVEVNKLTAWQDIRIKIANVLLILLPLAVIYRYRNKLSVILKKILK